MLNYAFFRIFFDYAFMQGVPLYAAIASQDPHGVFNALNALVFTVSSLVGLFMIAGFDAWPLTKFPVLMKQPVLGIAWGVLALVIGGSAFAIGVGIMKMDVMAFLVTVPGPYIFGTIVVLNMLENSLFGKLAQPGKGIANVIPLPDLLFGVF